MIIEIDELRSEFSVWVLIGSEEQQEALGTSNQSAGYLFTYFNSVDDLKVKLKEDIPHLIVFFSSALKETSVSEFFDQIRQVSMEVLIIALGEAEEFEEFKKYFLFGLFDFISGLDFFEERLLASLDRACELLYLKYQNEALFEEREKESLSQKSDLESSEFFDSTGKEVDLVNEYNCINNLFQRLDIKTSEEDLIAEFLSFMSSSVNSGVKVTFLSYFDAINSLAVSQCVGIPLEQVKDLGFKLDFELPEKAEDIEKKLIHFSTFINFTKQVLKTQNFRLFVLSDNYHFYGVFVLFFDNDVLIVEERIDVFFALFSHRFKFFVEQKKNFENQINDPKLPVYNEDYLKKMVDVEINRSRRLKIPTCLLLVSIDYFEQLFSQLGKPKMDLLLLSMAKILKKSLRTTDFLSSHEPGSFWVLFAHTSNKGAQVWAERFRRAVEAALFRFLPEDFQKITVSISISEFPSFARDKDELFRGTKDQVEESQKESGNQVKIVQPTDNFKPEFIYGE